MVLQAQDLRSLSVLAELENELRCLSNTIRSTLDAKDGCANDSHYDSKGEAVDKWLPG